MNFDNSIQQSDVKTNLWMRSGILNHWLSGQPKWSTLFLKTWQKKVGFGKVLEEKRQKKSRRDIPGQTWKFRDFFHGLNPGIFYPGIFQESKSRDFLVPGFFDPGISRDIPGPGYPVDIPIQAYCYIRNSRVYVNCIDEKIKLRKPADFWLEHLFDEYLPVFLT